MNQNESNPTLSVVICTYNRASLLQEALQTVCAQSLAPSAYEVIVVDNNSTDATCAVVMAVTAAYPQVRYCCERQVGLSHARNRGWQEAKGDYVVYFDDDCRVPPETLAVAYAIVQTHAPAAFGGSYKPFYQTPKPRWFKDGYGQHIPFAEAGFTATADWIFGEHFGVQRRVIETLGGFDPALGMVGKAIGYGEETVFFQQLLAHDPAARIYYDPRFFVYHLARPEKFTWRWVIRNRLIHGRYGYRTQKAQMPTKRSRLGLLLRLGKCVLQLAWITSVGTLLRPRARCPCVQSYWFEASDRPLYLCGFYYEEYVSR
jgi:glycosyltransferase involved in cell wall biosynthesis